MEQIDFIAIHRTAVFEIVDGPHAGKRCQIAEIDFKAKLITTVNDAKLPAELVRPILRKVTDIGDVEAAYLYKFYFGHDKADDWSGDTGSANFRPRKVEPTREHALRILDGRDFSQGDFEEWMGLVPFFIKNDFDFLNGAQRGWVKINNRYGA